MKQQSLVDLTQERPDVDFAPTVGWAVTPGSGAKNSQTIKTSISRPRLNWGNLGRVASQAITA